jgi:hypothetical protein
VASRVVLIKTSTICRAAIVSWRGARPSPLGTSATNWPILPDTDDRQVWQGKSK